MKNTFIEEEEGHKIATCEWCWHKMKRKLIMVSPPWAMEQQGDVNNRWKILERLIAINRASFHINDKFVWSDYSIENTLEV